MAGQNSSASPVQPEPQLPDVSTPEARERRRRYLRTQIHLLTAEVPDQKAGHRPMEAQTNADLVAEYRAELARLSRMDGAYDAYGS